ncbi:uncharacterized protein ARMOST_14844 [Armillaria ostoyae]|uniref:Uncharacterized protein n=1 Tax=Armillaria ostoyae TaxID=47428 RepID=A0A284RRP8_ARMOS|nr:uncharacterized protein ARMOST_14844 [Armillaria ostoyae]
MSQQQQQFGGSTPSGGQPTYTLPPLLIKDMEYLCADCENAGIESCTRKEQNGWCNSKPADLKYSLSVMQGYISLYLYSFRPLETTCSLPFSFCKFETGTGSCLSDWGKPLLLVLDVELSAAAQYFNDLESISLQLYKTGTRTDQNISSLDYGVMPQGMERNWSLFLQSTTRTPQ